MTIRFATAEWKGTLKEGAGELALESKVFKGPYNFVSRFETGNQTNPEELVAAAHAGCYSMFLSALLTEAGLTPVSIHTQANVTLGKDEVGPKITLIHLDCQAEVAGINDADFQALARKAKANCPISRLYAGTEVTLSAVLKA